MATKDWTIKLKHFDPGYNGQNTNHWIVEQIQNSIAYKPGQILFQREVAHLCENAFWKVTIINGNPQ